MLVRTGNGAETEHRLARQPHVEVITDLAAAAALLIAERRR
jgi:hypothetical protein